MKNDNLTLKKEFKAPEAKDEKLHTLADILGTARDYKKIQCQERELERLKKALGLKIETADFKKLLMGPRDGWRNIKSDVGMKIYSFFLKFIINTI